jgi:uncharacterized protein YdaU (DUF1376 family)
MAEFPSLDIWTDAYLADTSDLILAEHGAYLLMLMIAWRRHDNGLPDDMPWLKRAMGAHCAALHGHTFNAVVPRLLTRFWTLDPVDKIWRQKRLEKEREYRRKRSANQSQNAVKRWSNQNQTLFKPDPGENDINDLADATASKRHMPPAPPRPTRSTESSSSSPSTASARDKTNAQNPNGNGFRAGSVTIENPATRLAIFQRTIAERLGPSGYDIVLAATDANSSQHARSLALCKAAAKALGKGWPRQWVITPVRDAHKKD